MTLRLLCSTDTEADTEDSRELRPLIKYKLHSSSKTLGKIVKSYLAFTPPSSVDYDMFHAMRQINVY